MKLSPFVLSAVVLFAGCATPERAPVATQKLSCRIPEIAPLPESDARHDKGGVEITIIPSNYKAVRKDRRIINDAEPNFGEALLAPRREERDQYSFVEERLVPALKSQPDRLEFAVRVNNKLSRVFRGQGSVIQVNVGGKLIPVNRKDYAEFVDSIVPPRNEMELKIYGPAVESLPDKGTIGIFIFDVVTATDQAGNVTEKQNYEWYFNYVTKVAEDSATPSVKRGWMKNDALRRMSPQSVSSP